MNEGHRAERLLVGGEHDGADVELAVEDERLDVVRALLPQLEDDPRVGRVELREQRGEERDPDDGRHPDAQPPAAQRRQLDHLLLHHPHRVEDALRALEHDPAGLGEPDAPPLAQQERRPELLLERPHPLADRGLRDVQRLARAREALLARDLDEVPERLDVHVGNHSFRCSGSMERRFRTAPRSRRPRDLASSVSDLTLLEMQVTTNGSYGGIGWEPYLAGKVFDLTAASSTLSARVRDAAGHVTDLLSGVTVNLDNTVPVLTMTLATASPTNNLTVGLTLSSEAGSEVRVSPIRPLLALPGFRFRTRRLVLSEGDGIRTIYGRVRDAAGNLSDLKTVTVTIDRTAPQNASFTILGRQLTNSRAISLITAA